MMLRDFLNLRSLEPFRRLGRTAQFVGFALVVSPIASALMRLGSGRPREVFGFEELPEYSPLVFASRHPNVVDIVGLILGITLLIVGSRFLAREPWARVAMKRACWLGVAICSAYGALAVFASMGVSKPLVWLFTLGTAVFGSFFVYLLVKTSMMLETPEMLKQFKGCGSHK